MDRWRPTPDQRRAIDNAAWFQCYLPNEREDARQEALIGVWLAQHVNANTVASRRVLDWCDASLAWRRQTAKTGAEQEPAHADTPEALLMLQQTVAGLSAWQRARIRAALA